MRGFSLVVPALLMPAALLVSCAANKPAGERELVSVVDESSSPANSRRVAASLPEALQLLHRWGPLRAKVTLRILPDHASLERAAHQSSLPWLRAWTFPGELFLQAPGSWPDETTEALTGLLAHELAHALLYQLLGDEAEEPPLWFREGIASVTANQQAHRMTLNQLRAWRLAHPGVDLFAPDTALLHDEHAAVYSAAHLAFRKLLDEHGEAAILGLLREERGGAPFALALQHRLGVEEALFLNSLR